MSTLDDQQLTDLIVQRISVYDIRNKGPVPDVETRFERSAVLMPLSVHEGNVYIWLTKRSAHLRSHPSEVSFPGGKRDDTDSSDIDVALREADEEIGLSADQVKIIGMLTPSFISNPNSIVYPIVGLIPHDFKPVCNPSEVDFAFCVPLRDFLDEKNISYQVYPVEGGSHYISRHVSYVVEDGKEVEIWGFTSGYCLIMAKMVFSDTLSFKMLVEEEHYEDFNTQMERYFDYFLSFHNVTDMKSKL